MVGGRMAGGRRRRARDDAGQLMLLSGIVITIAFILTSMTLSQVSSLERQAASDRATTLSAEWRFLHERLATNLEVAISPETSVSSFSTDLFPIIVATFRNIEAEKGYDTVIRLAGDDLPVNKTESDLVTGGKYDGIWDARGTFDYSDLDADADRDGLIVESTCSATGSSGSCIAGVLVYLHLNDGTSSMEEVILFSVNRD